VLLHLLLPLLLYLLRFLPLQLLLFHLLFPLHLPLHLSLPRIHLPRLLLHLLPHRSVVVVCDDRGPLQIKKLKKYFISNSKFKVQISGAGPKKTPKNLEI
jgi:hypothetical protein